MKKFIIAIVTLLVFILSVLTLTSCSKIPKDYKDVRSNLRRNDYDVLVCSKSDEAVDLVSGLLHELVYALDDENSIKKGENLLSFIGEDENELIKDIDYCVAGLSENGEGEDMLLVIYFDDTEALETHYNSFVEIFDLIRSNIFNVDEILVDNSDLKYRKTKNILYFGTEQAIKDAN